MGGIPVLNDSQLTALRRVVGTNQKLNLTVTPQGKSRKLPTYSDDDQPEYDGPFALSYNGETDKIDVKAGFLNRNGEWKTVPDKSVSPETGYICVVTELDDNGDWSDPEIEILDEPDEQSYPIGYCEVTGSGDDKGVTFSSFRVPVAFFLISDVCSKDN